MDKSPSQMQTHELLAYLDQRDKPQPLVDPESVRVANFLAAPPHPRRWLLEGLLPLGVVGALAAAGGVGKSFLMIQLAMAVATGRPFMGLKVVYGTSDSTRLTDHTGDRK